MRNIKIEAESYEVIKAFKAIKAYTNE